MNKHLLNAETQIASQLAAKVDRFIKARKGRARLMEDIVKLTNELSQAVVMLHKDEQTIKPIPPLPTPLADKDLKNPKIPLGWRKLEPAEKIKESDLVLNGDDWLHVHSSVVGQPATSFATVITLESPAFRRERQIPTGFRMRKDGETICMGDSILDNDHYRAVQLADGDIVKSEQVVITQI